MRRLIIFMLVMWAPGLMAANMDDENNIVDCRHSAPNEYPPESKHLTRVTPLPFSDYFQPLLADPFETRLAMSAVQYSIKGDEGFALREDGDFPAGLATIGVNFGSYRFDKGSGCKGIQSNFIATAYVLVGWGSGGNQLMNTDYRVGWPLTMRSGPYSARLTFYHQSSHLGDEFLLKNPTVERKNLSYEAVEALGSVDFDTFRLYGGTGLILQSSNDLDPGIAQLGMEYRGREFEMPLHWFVANVRPVAGLDLKAFQEREWGASAHLVAGMEVFSKTSLQRFRVLFTYMNGYVPYGQFFDVNKGQHYGIGFHFDL